MCWVVYHPKFLNSKGVLSKFPTKVGKNRMPKNKFPKVGNFIYKRCDNISTPSKKTCRQKKKTTTLSEYIFKVIKSMLSKNILSLK